MVTKIGAGDQAEVWLGEHDTLSTTHALKIFNPTKDSESLHEEAKQLVGLQSESIVSVYNAGMHGDRPWFSMAYLEGGTLQENDRLISGSVNPAQLESVAVRINSALAAAHEQHIMHRDIKPSNILLDSQGNTYLSDFGLAVKTTLADRGKTQVGTFTYMAPEVLEGNASAASDIYSFGAVLYWLWENSEVPLFAQQEVIWSRPGLPVKLEQLISAMIMRDPLARPTLKNIYDTLVLDHDTPPYEAPKQKTRINIGIESIFVDKPGLSAILLTAALSAAGLSAAIAANQFLEAFSLNYGSFFH